jgi:hypothetical protein
MKTIFLVAVAFAILGTTFSCKDDDDPIPEVPVLAVKATGITLNSEGNIDVTISKDSSIVFEYNVQAPGLVKELKQTLDGTETNFVGIVGQTEHTMKKTIDIPYEDKSIELKIDLTDQSNQTTTTTIKINITTIFIPEATSFTDDFNRADGDLGGNWESPFKPMSINSNAAYSPPQSGNSWSRHVVFTNSPDQKASFKFVSSTAAGPVVGVILRSSGDGVLHSAYACVTRKSGNYWAIYKIVGDVFTALSEGTSATQLADGDRILATVVGTTISLYKNGELQGSVENADITSGQTGLGRFFGTGTATALLDDFSTENVTD